MTRRARTHARTTNELVNEDVERSVSRFIRRLTNRTFLRLPAEVSQAAYENLRVDSGGSSPEAHPDLKIRAIL